MTVEEAMRAYVDLCALAKYRRTPGGLTTITKEDVLVGMLLGGELLAVAGPDRIPPAWWYGARLEWDFMSRQYVAIGRDDSVHVGLQIVPRPAATPLPTKAVPPAQMRCDLVFAAWEKQGFPRWTAKEAFKAARDLCLNDPRLDVARRTEQATWALVKQRPRT
jgi:hypothetical protein